MRQIGSYAAASRLYEAIQAEGCYQGPARQLLSNWKTGNLVIQEQAVIAFRKVTS